MYTWNKCYLPGSYACSAATLYTWYKCYMSTAKSLYSTTISGTKYSASIL